MNPRLRFICTIIFRAAEWKMAHTVRNHMVKSVSGVNVSRGVGAQLSGENSKAVVAVRGKQGLKQEMTLFREYRWRY
jgi:hypothetical protein